MTGFVQWLSTNPWVWLIVSLAGVLGTMSSVVFYYKSKRVKEPKYLTHSSSLIRDFSQVLTNLDVSYAGRRINNLTSTTIVLWNDGRETISSVDIAKSDPIRINLVGEGVIVNCYAVATNNPANQIQVSLVNEEQASINFDFLDYKQGAVIQVLHTGRGSEDLALQGTVIGAGNFALENRYSNDDSTRFTLLGRKYDVASLLLLTLLGGAVVSVGKLIAHGTNNGSGIGLYSFLVFLLCIMFYLQGTAVLPALPKGLGTVDINGWRPTHSKKAEIKKR